MAKVKTGLQRFFESEWFPFKGSNIGLVCNATSVDGMLRHSIDVMLEHPHLHLSAVYGPQHGIYGETQDNMVEWDGYRDQLRGVQIYSLYSSTRIPTPEMMEDIDAMVFDMQDIGSRYYTFIYTMAHVMTACKRDGKKMIVLDRPNPLNGMDIEGNILHNRYASFVGMYPITIRHGMTVGELALMFNDLFGIECDLHVIKMENWRRDMWYDQTGLHWVIPSPNMPTLETATVYPGMCLLEGTNVSEGRGTTRPFELFGAPFIEPERLCAELRAENLPGVLFRAVKFRPTFQKWKGIVCGGSEIHVTDRSSFKPVLTAVAILRNIRLLYPDQFRWRLPPYEYEYEKLPFDILAGTSRIRRLIDLGTPLHNIEAFWKNDEHLFQETRKPFLLY